MHFKQSTSFLLQETTTALEKMKTMVPLFILAALLATCHGADYQTFPLRMRTGGLLDKQYPTEVYCNSWRLAVETHNKRGFKTVTTECQDYVSNYMVSDQYESDSKQVCIQANYHTNRKIDTERDVFVFGVDDTVLSSVPYYEQNGFGSKPYNSTAWHKWVARGTAPALPQTLRLYGVLVSRGIKIVFLTTRADKYRAVTASNLKKAGFHTWEKLITKSDEYNDKTKQEYKTAERQKLVEEGYNIIGNIGDQWSDLLGEDAGERTFKLPNPVYYVV